MDIEFYMIFLIVYGIPALAILVGIEFAVWLVKFFSNKKKGIEKPELTTQERVTKIVGVIALHGLGFILSPIPVILIGIMCTAFVPLSTIPVLVTIINVGIIFLLAKVIHWVAKPFFVTKPSVA